MKSIAACAALLTIGAAACTAPKNEDTEVAASTSELSANERSVRYARIRDASRARGFGAGFLLAGIAFTESGMAQCWSEATWACAGPASPDCGGGPVIAGKWDGPCSEQKGGLGMFQFDAGKYADTLRVYGPDVLTIDGQVAHAIDYVVAMVRDSEFTTNAETTEKARAWVLSFDPDDAVRRDQWIKTVLRLYNGCPPNASCWSPRYQTYSEGLSTVLAETGGTAYWRAGTTCPGGSGVVVGAIEAKYRALGGCASLLGAPVTNELATPDRIGRYSVFANGSIYWKPALGAHEVHGRIRDEYEARGWEAGALGYPTSDEVAVAGGRKSDFEHGSITWRVSTDDFVVEVSP